MRNTKEINKRYYEKNRERLLAEQKQPEARRAARVAKRRRKALRAAIELYRLQRAKEVLRGAA